MLKFWRRTQELVRIVASNCVSARIAGLLLAAFLAFLGSTSTQGHPVGELPQQPPAPSPQASDKLRAPELTEAARNPTPTSDYRIGPDDLLAIAVVDVPELTRSVRVSAGGEISLPLVGVLAVGGLSPRQLELTLQDVLRRTYVKDPQISVQVLEMQSHRVSVMGAVRKPGIFLIPGPKSLLEVLSMAEGLAEDAGEHVVILRAAKHKGNENPGATTATAKHLSAGRVSPDEAIPDDADVVNLKDLLESGDSSSSITIEPGDVVKVQRAGLVYVVGEVNKPGGYALRNNENLTVLQAVALSEGLSPAAAKSAALILRTENTGERREIAVDLGKLLKGKSPDVALQAKDVLVVPGSSGKKLARGMVDAMVRMVTLRGVILGP